MKSLITRNGIGFILVAFVFCLFSSMASAVTKHEMFEMGERIKVLQAKINVAYEELRKLNEEGGENSQEQAQLIMAQIKEMKTELKKLESNLEKLKNGGSCEFEGNSDSDLRDAERLRKLSKR